VHPNDIARQKTQSFSQNVMDLYGTGSIAEAAALAAAGSKACLLAPRIICAHRMVTCAFAKGDQI
jgi:cobalt-precorrin 5A hydrolase